VRYADDDIDSRHYRNHRIIINRPRCNLGDLIDKKQKKSESAIKEIGEIQLWNFRLAIAEYDIAVRFRLLEGLEQHCIW
jgi:hypothetical protein